MDKKIVCRYTKTVTESETSDWCLCMYTSKEIDGFPEAVQKNRKGKNCWFFASGNALPQIQLVDIILYGEWVAKKNGWQFATTSFEVKPPRTEQEMTVYLSSGAIKGIGKATAARLVEHFGTDVLKIMEETPERLLEVRGVREDQLENIKNSFGLQLSLVSLQSLLGSIGLSGGKISEIYRHFGDDAANRLRKSPYDLLECTSFENADQLAESLGFCKESQERLEAGICHFIKETCAREGHTFLYKDDVIRCTAAFLSVDEGLVRKSFADLVTERKIIYRFRDTLKAVFLPEYDAAEYDIAECIRNLQGGADEKLLENAEAVLAEGTLTEGQKEAVRKMAENNLLIITGGAGTGKTTVAKTAIQVFENTYPERPVVLLAPTGKAAGRLAEATKKAASTVHSALKLETGNKFLYYQERLPEDSLIVIDEFSMVDLFVAQALFRAIPTSCRVILLGDVNQLPSVGPGTVLSEFVRSGKVCVAYLTEILRQGKDSSIISNSVKVNEGRTDFRYDRNFTFIQANWKDATEKVLDTYQRECARYGEDGVAILSPLRKLGNTSAATLNKEVQNLKVYEEEQEGKVFGTVFRKGDKILQTKNTEMAANGDTGTIRSVWSEQNSQGVWETFFSIQFDNGTKVRYTKKDMENVDLSYAMTIHKSQGSEYPSVIIPLLSSKKSLLFTRRLLYTAITRGKEHVTIIGSSSAIEQCCQQSDVSGRNTMLANRI